jgi:predicted transcriptional regulator
MNVRQSIEAGLADSTAGEVVNIDEVSTRFGLES